MASAFETILVQVADLLTDPTPFIDGDYGVRRSHRTPIRREDAPGAHVVAGEHRPAKGRPCGQREGDFTVSIFVRDDSAGTEDPFVVELYKRMGEATWPDGVAIAPGRISLDTEVADGDASRVDCVFLCSFPTAGEWSLELP